MDENRTNLMAEFQKLRLETSGISQNLMVSTRSVDARPSSNSEMLKVMNENHNAIRKGIEEIQRKLTKDNQNLNQLMKEVIRNEVETVKKKQEENYETHNQLMIELLDELRLARMEIAIIKNKQDKDRKEMENIKTITSQIQETLKNPKIVELCGYWTLSLEESPSSNFLTLTKKHHFSEEGNILTWLFWTIDERQDRFPKMRIGSSECKIREDGKIEIGHKFELEVKEKELTIEYNDEKIVYIKSNS